MDLVNSAQSPDSQASNSTEEAQNPISINNNWINIIESLLYLALSVYVIVILCGTLRMNGRQKSGIYFKKTFLWLLFSTTVFRTVGSVVVFVTEVSLKDGGIFWVSHLLITIPSLLFVTSFSVFLFFFAKIASQEERVNNISKPLIVLLNLLIYASFLGTFIYYASADEETPGSN